MDTDARVPFQQLLEELQAPIADLDSLLTLLSAPLDALGLLPPRFRSYNTRPLPSSRLNVSKYIPQIQRVLLTHVVPTWDTLLAESNATSLLEQYFCPDSFSNALSSAGEVAIDAYATLIMFILPAAPQISFVLWLLERLALEYPIDRLYTAVFVVKEFNVSDSGMNLRWEDCIKNLVAIPARVGNALGVAGKTDKVPSVLENAHYFNHLSSRCERLIFELSKPSSAISAFPGTSSFFLSISLLAFECNSVPEGRSLPALAYLINKLVNQGIFPSQPPVARSQPSFFESTLSSIRHRIMSDTTQSYFSFWSRLLLALPSNFALQSVLTSLFSALRISEVIEHPTDDAPSQRARVRQEAALLDSLVGKITQDNDELWEVCTSLMLSSRDWHESYARVFVCWVSGGSRSSMVNLKGMSFCYLAILRRSKYFNFFFSTTALGAFLEIVLDVWSSPEHIKHSLISRHRCKHFILGF